LFILSAPANALAIMLIGFFRWMGFDTLLDRGRGVFLQLCKPIPVPAGSLIEDPAMPVNGSGTGTAGSSTRDPAGTSKNGYHTEPLDCGAVGLAYYTEPLCKSSFTND
jgi:hypothetical protein